MRISKIFKKLTEGASDQQLPKGIKPEPLTPAEGQQAAPSETGHHHDTSIKISAALNKELEKDRPSTATIAHIYEELVAKARKLHTAGESAKINFSAELDSIIDKIADSIFSGNDELLLICLRGYSKPEDMFYCHIANVVIIAIAIGRELGYERNRILELGIATFVHDIGSKESNILNKPSALTDDEINKIKRHPDEGALILSEMDAGLSQRVLDAVSQEHERADGSGYPKGLVSDEITEYAKIVGLADVYEALMHNRPYRPSYTSLDAIRIILKNKKIFSRRVLKALLEAFGIFPVETLVQLNTKEIGVVVKRNSELISRPVLDIIIDSTGKEMKQPRRINLVDNPVIYIDTCVKQEEISVNV